VGCVSLSSRGKVALLSSTCAEMTHRDTGVTSHGEINRGIKGCLVTYCSYGGSNIIRQGPVYWTSLRKMLEMIVA
jgi:hypothetical protein